MNVYLYAELNGRIDSKSLWHDVETYGVNVTDLHVKTLIYGEVSLRVALVVVDIASKYGKIQAHITYFASADRAFVIAYIVFVAIIKAIKPIKRHRLAHFEDFDYIQNKKHAKQCQQISHCKQTVRQY